VIRICFVKDCTFVVVIVLDYHGWVRIGLCKGQAVANSPISLFHWNTGNLCKNSRRFTLQNSIFCV